MKKILIIGLGEIGGAISRIEKKAGNDVSVMELAYNENMREDKAYDIAHVCIPCHCENAFLVAVTSSILGKNIGVVIIHSTVGVGVTRSLSEVCEDRNFVHSFCRGVHPDLEEGLLTFEKAVGALDEDSLLVAAQHLESLGMKVKALSSPEASEFAKLLSTSYYGYNILFAKLAAEMSEELGLDFEEVYTWSNETYNEGYRKLGRDEVIRPVLRPPDGRIGGHCIMPNFHLLLDGPLKDWCIEQENPIVEPDPYRPINP